MPGEIDFLFHAVADVENDPETYRCHFIRKVTNLLLDLVLEQLEVFGFEIRDKPVCVVGDSHVHHDEIDIDFERSLRRGYDSGNEKHRTQNANLSSAGHRVGHTLSLYVHLFKWFVGLQSTAETFVQPGIALRAKSPPTKVPVCCRPLLLHDLRNWQSICTFEIRAGY